MLSPHGPRPSEALKVAWPDPIELKIRISFI